MKEQWRSIYKGYYAVSSYGRIRRLKSGNSSRTYPGKILNPYLMNKGYLSVTLYLPSGKKRKLLHVLVARVFLGKCPKGYEVDHKDKCRTNCVLRNLRYLPSKVNAAHKGIANGAAKLTNSKVRKIRRLFAKGCSKAYIARRFKVTAENVGAVVNRTTWKHVLD